MHWKGQSEIYRTTENHMVRCESHDMVPSDSRFDGHHQPFCRGQRCSPHYVRAETDRRCRNHLLQEQPRCVAALRIRSLSLPRRCQYAERRPAVKQPMSSWESSSGAFPRMTASSRHRSKSSACTWTRSPGSSRRCRAIDPPSLIPVSVPPASQCLVERARFNDIAPGRPGR